MDRRGITTSDTLLAGASRATSNRSKTEFMRIIPPRSLPSTSHLLQTSLSDLLPKAGSGTSSTCWAHPSHPVTFHPFQVHSCPALPPPSQATSTAPWATLQSWTGHPHPSSTGRDCHPATLGSSLQLPILITSFLGTKSLSASLFSGQKGQGPQPGSLDPESRPGPPPSQVSSPATSPHSLVPTVLALSPSCNAPLTLSLRETPTLANCAL